MDSVLVLRVAARFQRQADQPAGQRQKAKRLTAPINSPKGIAKGVKDEHGDTIATGDETVDPDRRDIRPKDVFNPTPNQMGVRNFAETGKDLQKALDRQVPKDKGYDTVNNLSQYLIRTDGGGGTKPQGKPL